jgi:hypothetical protein
MLASNRLLTAVIETLGNMKEEKERERERERQRQRQRDRDRRA